MISIDSTLLNNVNKENILNDLNNNSLKLLELLHVNHDALHTITVGAVKDKTEQSEQYVQISIKVDELNKVAHGMASLASIIALNPSFKPEKTN